MEVPKLTEAEQRCFGELFGSCDTDNQGWISASKAFELFLASQLPTDTLQQIRELCGARRLGHFGRSQFYIALKLIALAQTGQPPKLELLSSGAELPLPRFGGRAPEQNDKDFTSPRNKAFKLKTPNNSRGGGIPPGSCEKSPVAPGQLPPPPSTAKSRSGSGQRQGSLPDTSPSHHAATVPILPPCQPQVPLAAVAPVVVPPAATVIPTAGESPPRDIPSPVAHNDKRWTAFNNEVTWAQFEEHRHLLTAANDEDSSERHSSGGEEDGDCWTVTEEQREYYTTQFLNMQPDLKGKISGGVAKEFFEMSRLPVHELSRIWHLSDLDKDGALTLEEFCIAMHLVVLRRHQIDLPAETLPPSMLPPRKLPEDGSGRYANLPLVPPASPPVAPITKLPPVTTPPTASSPPNKEWTKFNDSPTSSMSSPGMKPVNFDFPAASVEQDPRILHPVALRLSPDGQPNDIGHYPSLPDFMPLHGSGHLEPPINSSTPDTKKVNTGGSSVHRPVPRKPSGGNLPAAAPLAEVVDNPAPPPPAHNNSFSGSSSSANQVAGGAPKKEPPPPPPPRPRHNHTRSSSLDLNRLGQTVPHFIHGPPPPAIPPRLSPCMATPKSLEDGEFVADFTQLEDSPQPSLKAGAFEVYKKPPLSDSVVGLNSEPVSDESVALLGDQLESGDRKRHLSAPPLALAATQMTAAPRDRKELLAAIQAHRARNQLLQTINADLSQELQEAMEERTALEIQLEHIRRS